MKKLSILLFLLFNAAVSAHAGSFVKGIAYLYCELSHPVEKFSPIRYGNTCEEQHVIQQQHGGSDWGNITIVSTSSHIATDTWGGDGVVMQGKVWESSTPEDPWGTTSDSEKALGQAYKLGRWQLEYTFLLYDYGDDEWSTTLLNWDGMSHLTYAISWWVNFPSKYLRKAAYLMDKERYLLMVDHLIQLPILIIEGCVGVFYNGIGVVVGTVMNPFDTLNAVVGGIFLILQSIVMGIVDLLLSIFLFVKSIL